MGKKFCLHTSPLSIFLFPLSIFLSLSPFIPNNFIYQQQPSILKQNYCHEKAIPFCFLIFHCVFGESPVYG